MAASKTDQSTGLLRHTIFRMIGNLGIQGLFFSTIVTFGAGWLLLQLQGYMLDVVLRSCSRPGVSKQLIDAVIGITCVAAWIPFIPVLLVALFLPVRLAWIHGRVPIGQLFQECGGSLGFAIATLHIVWRRLVIALLPLFGIGLLVHELIITHQPVKLLQILIGASSLGALVVLWRAAGIVSAAPIAILSHSNPLAAAAECELIVRGAHRAKLLGLMVLLCCCGGAGVAINYYAAELTPWEFKLSVLADLIAAWAIGIIAGIVCLKATVIYHWEKQAGIQAANQPAYENTIVNGQRVVRVVAQQNVIAQQNMQNGNRR